MTWRIHSVLDLGAVLRRPGYAVREQFSKHVDTTKDAPPANKYGNEKTNGYASAKEAKRAGELQLLERAGQIRNLHEQVPFLLVPNQYDDAGKLLERSCTYIADFVFEEAPDWRQVVVDVKGVQTDVYIVKRKLMLFVYGVRIREE